MNEKPYLDKKQVVQEFVDGINLTTREDVVQTPIFTPQEIISDSIISELGMDNIQLLAKQLISDNRELAIALHREIEWQIL